MTRVKLIRRVVLLTGVLSLLLVATPVHASVGTNCGAWSTGNTSGGHQQACTVRSAVFTATGQGKAYFATPSSLTALDISIGLYQSADGTNYTRIASHVCDFTSVASSSSSPNICNTSTLHMVAGDLYKSRIIVVLFYKSGMTVTSTPSWSLVTA